MAKRELPEYYTGLSDDALLEALSIGPEGYVDHSTWTIISDEAQRRGLRSDDGRGERPAAAAELPMLDTSGSAVYTVFVGRDGREVAVKRGFCWPAFCFLGLWAAVTRQWSTMAVLLLASILIYGITRASNGSAIVILGMVAAGLAIRLWIGVNGNEFRRKNLMEKGFTPFAELRADGAADALAAYRRSQTAA